MKIACITDTHFGARGDSAAFADFFNVFYYEYFFPYLQQNNIKQIIHLGDIVDRRKYINYVTARHLKKFIEECHNKNIKLDILIGNHDTSFKNTNDVNCMNELFSHTKYNISYYSEPQEVVYDGLKIAILPWVCSGNYQQSMEFINKTNAQILFGHLEIQGFEMYKGSYNDHGFSPDIFNKFDVVCSGHFHHKSSRGNIHYLGAPYEMNWSDYNDMRGFHVFDTETRELQFIENPYKIFKKLFYNDEIYPLEELLQIDDVEGKYVKVVIQSKNNPYWFDLYIDKIEKSGVVDLQVIEDHLNLDLENDKDIIDEAEDTMTILKKVVDQNEMGVDKKRLESFLRTLYTEALSVG